MEDVFVIDKMFYKWKQKFPKTNLKCDGQFAIWVEGRFKEKQCYADV